jgi:hypothetical protein
MGRLARIRFAAEIVAETQPERSSSDLQDSRGGV